MKRGNGTGTITKLGETRYWARGPSRGGGKRPSLGTYPTREEAQRRLDAELAAKTAPARVATGRMRVVRELRPSSTGGVIEYLTFETNDELEREAQARLERHLRDWKRAREIRAYVKDVRAALAEWDYEPPEGGEIDTWLEWCEYQLSIDPIDEFRAEAVRAAIAKRKGVPRDRPRKSQ